MGLDPRNQTSVAAPELSDKTPRFLGKPAALGYLASTEAWERFSYYGMTSTLVLYISGALMLLGLIT